MNQLFSGETTAVCNFGAAKYTDGWRRDKSSNQMGTHTREDLGADLIMKGNGW
jgi:hypothetical protein